MYNDLGIDGSTITNFAADYAELCYGLSTAADFQIADLYAFHKYKLTADAEAIRVFFGVIQAEDTANFRIRTSVADFHLDNAVSGSYKQTDNRRFYRDSGDGYPVLIPTATGYGLDVVWRNKILIAETEVSALTPEQADQLDKAAKNSGLIPALL